MDEIAVESRVEIIAYSYINVAVQILLVKEPSHFSMLEAKLLHNKT